MVGDVLSSRFVCLSFFECLTTQTHYKSEKNKKPTKTSLSKILVSRDVYVALQTAYLWYTFHTTPQVSVVDKEQMITMDKRRKLSNINL